MMNTSPAYASKLIKQKSEEIRELLFEEQQTATTTACVGEDVDELRKAYDFKATQEKIDKLNDEIVRIKHAINRFNTEHMLPGLGYSIDMALVKMKMLSDKKARMAKMKAVRSVVRNGVTYGNSQPEYTHRNYEAEDAAAEYEKTADELTKLQLALDEANLKSIIELDVD